MKFRTLAIAALLGAMNIEEVAALQKKHHHHHPNHHSKMQTFEDPVPAKPVDPEPDFQEQKDKLKKMDKKRQQWPLEVILMIRLGLMKNLVFLQRPTWICAV